MDGEIEGGFPIYILDDDSIFFIKKDIDHSEFWQNQIAAIVSKKFSVSFAEILNLPYCQKRGRIVGNKLYCGERLSKKIIKKIEDIVGLKLKYYYDEHETRCKISMSQYAALKTPYQ